MILFKAYGHENVLCKHKNTFEFTKDKDLTLQGDCIVGVRADFDYDELKEFISDKEKIKIKISVDGLSEEINCLVNSDFCSKEEIVVRKSDFNSDRTLGIKADKACIDFSREFVGKLRKDVEINIIIT